MDPHRTPSVGASVPDVNDMAARIICERIAHHDDMAQRWRSLLGLLSNPSNVLSPGGQAEHSSRRIRHSPHLERTTLRPRNE